MSSHKNALSLARDHAAKNLKILKEVCQIPTEPSREEKLIALCEKFIHDNQINCAETVCQTDRVIENAYDFLVDMCDIVGYYEYPEDE